MDLDQETALLDAAEDMAKALAPFFKMAGELIVAGGSVQIQHGKASVGNSDFLAAREAFKKFVRYQTTYGKG